MSIYIVDNTTSHYAKQPALCFIFTSRPQWATVAVARNDHPIHFKARFIYQHICFL